MPINQIAAEPRNPNSSNKNEGTNDCTKKVDIIAENASKAEISTWKNFSNNQN